MLQPLPNLQRESKREYGLVRTEFNRKKPTFVTDVCLQEQLETISSVCSYDDFAHFVCRRRVRALCFVVREKSASVCSTRYSLDLLILFMTKL
jgi:hypothetical protein